jgi:hypothetical protein
MKILKPIWRKLGRDSRGQEIAEFAALLPILFLVLIGIFWFGQAFRMYGTITHAAREGARAAVAPACATCSSATTATQNAWNAVQSALNAANMNPTLAQQPTVLPPLCQCVEGQSSTSCTGSSGSPSPLSCDPSQSHICVQGDTANISALLSSPGTGGAGTCGVSVSFQYPYAFWLPFSALGGQKVYLRAQAQMRWETQ